MCKRIISSYWRNTAGSPWDAAHWLACSKSGAPVGLIFNSCLWVSFFSLQISELDKELNSQCLGRHGLGRLLLSYIITTKRRNGDSVWKWVSNKIDEQVFWIPILPSAWYFVITVLSLAFFVLCLHIFHSGFCSLAREELLSHHCFLPSSYHCP